ncbi:MAG: hypothetical protein KGQ42_00210 [Alphaproteobacteria bacterium]|nr:hypothetical protein [Alphaproteobacteria bacterium]MDE2339692.1 hypothetical protein [Alphaproteobacteria bacterium]
MAEPKPIASLSSGLLARKGSARPAMRPHGLINFGNAAVVPENDDLGWNDMGHEAGPTPPVPIEAHIELPPVPVTPEVVVQQRALAKQVAPDAASAPRAVPGSKGKAAFTLRLDPERHLKLRMLSALSHRSSQRLVTEALDALLGRESDNFEHNLSNIREGY